MPRKRFPRAPSFFVCRSCGHLRWVGWSRRNKQRAFEFDRRQIAEGRMQPLAVIDLFDELSDMGSGLGQVAVFLPVNLFVLERFHERFAGSIVVWVAPAAHADADSVLFEQPGVIVRCVLNAAVGMVSESLG